MFESIRERLGEATGAVIAPLFFLTGFIRGARALHPRGQVFMARIDPIPEAQGAARALAKRLRGTALIRLSSAGGTQSPRSMDALGFAIRFGWSPGEGFSNVQPKHQDLLLSTVRHSYTLPFAIFTTDVSDYSANDYFSIAPFDIGAADPVKFRLIAIPSPAEGETRDQKIRSRLTRDSARFRLEMASPDMIEWEPIVYLRMLKELDLQEAQLTFSPFNAGRGVKPVGAINALRRITYEASQSARALRGRLHVFSVPPAAKASPRSSERRDQHHILPRST